MTQNQILILKYLELQGKSMVPTIHAFYRSEMTPDDFEKSIKHLYTYDFILSEKENWLYTEITNKGITKLAELRTKEANYERKNNQENIKSEFEIENLNLQNENLRYSKSTRKKDNKISELTIKNLKLQNRQLKWNIVFIIIGFLIGFLTSNFKLILKFFGIDTVE